MADETRDNAESSMLETLKESRPSLPSAPIRILVADDEPRIRSFLRAVLEPAGYQVFLAADGKDAFRQALSARVDLVIMDLVMPEQEGIETIQVLRRRAPGLGIIAMSGAFGGQFLEVARQIGADAVIAKPLSPVVLLRKVAEVLEKTR